MKTAPTRTSEHLISSTKSSHAASRNAIMPQNLHNKEPIIEGKFSQGECVELKVRSREEEILRELGVLHLEGKVTRPRHSADETEISILKQAGVRYFNTAEYEESEWKKRGEKKNKELRDKLTKPMNIREAEILKTAGITWVGDETVSEDDETVSKDDETVSKEDDADYQKLECGTGNTETITLGESTVNSTYAERELLRRLKHGWSSTGKECEECGMPIIFRSRGDLLECVICGLVGDDEYYDPDINYNPDADDVDLLHEGPGVFDVGPNSSTFTEPSDRFNAMEEPSYEGYHRPECQAPSVECADLGEYQRMNSDSCAEKIMFDGKICEQVIYEGDDDDEYKEELGLRLFDGWKMTKLNCPSCNLPLISDGDCAPSICLRCG